MAAAELGMMLARLSPQQRRPRSDSLLARRFLAES
jgi:hypothetical protein